SFTNLNRRGSYAIQTRRHSSRIGSCHTRPQAYAAPRDHDAKCSRMRRFTSSTRAYGARTFYGPERSIAHCGQNPQHKKHKQIGGGIGPLPIAERIEWGGGAGSNPPTFSL